MEQTQAVTGGQAKARWRFRRDLESAAGDFVVTLGQARTEKLLIWERVPLFGDLQRHRMACATPVASRRRRHQAAG